jgi:hypothetical protein
MTFPTTVAGFRQDIEAAAVRLRRFDEKHSSTPRAPGKWTPKQILGHLIDSAANNHARFVLGQLRDDLDFPGYDQDAWVAVQRHDARPWQELVELWRAYNLHLAHVMERADPAALSRSRQRHSLDKIAFEPSPASRPVTLEELMLDYIAHLRHHLAQVFAED